MTFNKRKYNATLKTVRKYLEKNPDVGKSIVLTGSAGCGKSRMLSELELEFGDAGLTCVKDVPNYTRVTRNITQGKVFSSIPGDTLDYTQDDRFVVFNF